MDMQSVRPQLASIYPDAESFIARAVTQLSGLAQQNQPGDVAPAPSTNGTRWREGSLYGKEPREFTGDQESAIDFIWEFNNYWLQNDTHSAMAIPYARVSMALGYMRGKGVNNWKDKQLNLLRE